MKTYNITVQQLFLYDQISVPLSRFSVVQDTNLRWHPQHCFTLCSIGACLRCIEQATRSGVWGDGGEGGFDGSTAGGAACQARVQLTSASNVASCLDLPNPSFPLSSWTSIISTAHSFKLCR